MQEEINLRGSIQVVHHRSANTGMHILKGVAASPGIAVGRAFVLDPDPPVDDSQHIAPERVAGELSKFHNAVEVASAELLNAMELAKRESATVSGIVESYLLIVRDSSIIDTIVRRIESGMSAESAVAREFDVHKTLMYNARDPIMRSRAQDFEDVKERLIAAIRNRMLVHLVEAESVIVAPSVTPQDILFFKQTQTLGFATEIGGINSHACIMARDMGFPAVIGLRDVTGEIKNGDIIIVDGYSGWVVANPDTETLERYRLKSLKAEEYKAKLGELINQPTVTTDGVQISLLANVDTPDQVDSAVMSGAEGAGLVRSEVLLIHLGRYPTLEEETEWYRDMAERMYPMPLTIRAFDVGGDKFRQGIPHQEENPALGLRGIRFLLYRPDIFEQQICAILRASMYRNIRFMLPMVSMVEELDEARRLVKLCQSRLSDDGIEFDPNMQIGVMIETPAAALIADTFAEHADFLSIGTNDLAQYALATDRLNELVSDIFDALHPAVIRMVRMVVDAANRYNKSVSVCGEMAGHAAATEMLIGLGLRELSVAPRLLLELKQRIRNASAEKCRELEHELERCNSTQEVYTVLNATGTWRGKGEADA